MGVGEALHGAEEEKGSGKSPQHGEPFRHQTGEFKKVVDVVHHHQNQGDGLEGGAVQAPFLCCQHGKNLSFHSGYLYANSRLCRKYQETP